VGPRAGLDTVVKRKFPAPPGTRTPNHQALYHELSRLLHNEITMIIYEQVWGFMGGVLNQAEVGAFVWEPHCTFAST
jgi:hypothetical protein